MTREAFIILASSTTIFFSLLTVYFSISTIRINKKLEKLRRERLG